MKNRGFTLIELLAVVVILLVILIVALPTISNIVASAKIEAFTKDEQLMISASKKYITENYTNLPDTIGGTFEIKLSDLQSDDLIGTIKDPENKNTTCNGYVIIMKTGDNVYDYTPYLNCKSDIGSLAEDGLVAHYKFDDFQEPTTNYVPNPTIFNTGWSSYSNGNDGAFPTEFNVEGLNLINRRSWAGAYRGVTLPAPGTYTLSVWVKVISRTQTSVNAKLYTSGGGLSDQSVAASWSADQIGVWQKIEMTKTYTTTGITLYLICYGGTNAAGYEITAQYSMPQVEQKPYATSFASGTRQGIIKDYSGNGNHVTLDMATTPRWIEDRKTGQGVYQYNGTSNYTDIGVPKTGTSMGISSEMTIMFWTKFGNVTDGTRVGNVIGNYPNSPHLNIEGYTNGRIRFYWNSGEIDSSPSKDLRGAWHHVAITRKSSSNSIIYIDGKAEATLVAGTNRDILWPLRIGNDYRGAPGIPYNGLLDELRVYKRALIPTEITQIYNSEK